MCAIFVRQNDSFTSGVDTSTAFLAVGRPLVKEITEHIRDCEPRLHSRASPLGKYPISLCKECVMGFRFKAFRLHLLGSVCLLAVLLGGLYFGWYRWPGWYLAGAVKIALIMVS